jgi:choline dehydrogenase-like flavoprotein
MMQFYDYSASTLEIAIKKLPHGKLWPRWLVEPVLKKCFLGVGYLPSALSTRIRMRLDTNGNLLIDQSNLSPTKQQVNKSIRKSIRSLSYRFFKVGILMFPRGYIDAGAGGGVHHGGWLGMGVNSDRFGQPQGVKNIHLVDSSIFPSVPAGPITFSIMANAARIVDEIYS